MGVEADLDAGESEAKLAAESVALLLTAEGLAGGGEVKGERAALATLVEDGDGFGFARGRSGSAARDADCGVGAGQGADWAGGEPGRTEGGLGAAGDAVAEGLDGAVDGLCAFEGLL